MVGGVAEQAAGAVDPAWGSDPGDGVVDLDLPGVLVHFGVVPAAHQDHIVEVGGAAAGPPLHVVGVAGVAGHDTAGDDAAAVPGEQGGLLGRGGQALAAAEVEQGAVGGEQRGPMVALQASSSRVVASTRPACSRRAGIP